MVMVIVIVIANFHSHSHNNQNSSSRRRHIKHITTFVIPALRNLGNLREKLLDGHDEVDLIAKQGVTDRRRELEDITDDLEYLCGHECQNVR